MLKVENISINHHHLLPDLFLEQISMVPKTFEQLTFDCISFGIIKPILVTLKVEYRFSRCWGGGAGWGAGGGGGRMGGVEGGGGVHSFAIFTAVYEGT